MALVKPQVKPVAESSTSTGALPSGGGVVSSMPEWLQVPDPALTAAVYNVTVTEPQSDGNIIVFPDTLATLPTTSNVNFSKGETVANAAIGQLASDGKEIFFNESYGSPQLIVDFFGYFAQPLSTIAPPTPTSTLVPNARSVPMSHLAPKSAAIAGR